MNTISAVEHPVLAGLIEAGWSVCISPPKSSVLPAIIAEPSIDLALAGDPPLVALIFDRVSAEDWPSIDETIRKLAAGDALKSISQAGRIIYLSRAVGAERLLNKSTWNFGFTGRLRVRALGSINFLGLGTQPAQKWSRHPLTVSPADLISVNEAFIIELVDWLTIKFPTSGTRVAPQETTAAKLLTPVASLGAPWAINAAGMVRAGQIDWIWSVTRFHLDRYRRDLFALHGAEWIDHVPLAEIDEVILSNLTLTMSSTEWLPRELWSGFASEIRRKAQEHIYLFPQAQARQTIQFVDDAEFVGECRWLEDVVPLATRQAVVVAKSDGSEGNGRRQISREDISLAIEAIIHIPRRATACFLADVADHRPSLSLVKVPPGAGKTSSCIDEIIDTLARAAPGELGPVAFLSPTYSNIDELHAKTGLAGVDADADDNHLVAAAIRLGLEFGPREPGLDYAEIVRDRIQSLGLARPLKIMTYAGRIRAGCSFPAKMKAAMQIGAGASLCHATDEYGDDVYCPHYDTCPAILQKRELLTADLVFLPHAFLALSAPDEMDCFKGIVVDEAAQGLFLHAEVETIEALSSPRRRPHLTKSMKKLGILPEELMADRDDAWQLLTNCLNAQIDILDAFTGEVGGSGLISSALKLCELALAKHVRITPFTPQEDLDRYAAAPTARGLKLEATLWEIIEDIVRHRRRGDPRIIKTDRDGKPALRVAWRATPNWVEKPTMILDASADPEIISKLWNRGGDWVPAGVLPEADRDLAGRALVPAEPDLSPLALHEAGEFGLIAEQSLTTVMLSGAPGTTESYLPRNGGDPATEYQAALNIERARALITTIAFRNAGTRVLIGMSLAVRKAVCTAWRPPINADFVHYGALRGLNTFQRHGVALSIGRLELPPDILEGQEAALCFDDDHDLKEMAADGIQKKPGGRGAYEEREVSLRGNHRLIVTVPTSPTRWGSRLQKQAREEELRQFAGRLRAIPRALAGECAPLWMVCGGILPDGMTASAVLHVDDIIRDPLLGLWDIARRLGGVLLPSRLGEIGIGRAAGMAAYDLFRAAGFDAETGRAPLGWLWADGDKGGGFVTASLEDPWEAIRQAESIKEYNQYALEAWSLHNRSGASWTDCSKEHSEVALGQEVALRTETRRQIDRWAEDTGEAMLYEENPDKLVWPICPEISSSLEVLSVLCRRGALRP